MADVEELRARGGAVPRMLPAAACTSEAVLDRERRHLYAGTWTRPGRLDELLLVLRPADYAGVTDEQGAPP